MLADDRRVDAYLSAIRRTVRPDDVVLDVGTGPGLMAVAAAKAGAKSVVGVEPHAIVAVAHELAAANGVADRVRFLRGSARSIPSGLGATVVIEDLRGVLPLNADRFAVLRDVRARLLAPGARSIPAVDTLWVAPCAPAAAPPSARIPQVIDGIDVRALSPVQQGAWMRARLTADALLAEPQCWARIDLAGALPDRVRGEARFTLDRAATVGGWCVWFDAELAPGVTLSNAPGAPPALYGQAWFPLAAPVAVERGATIGVAFDAREVGDDWQWAWETRWSADGVPRALRQSTLSASMLDVRDLATVAPDAAPARHDQFAVYASLLSLADGRRSHREIGAELFARHAGRFASSDDAVAFAIHRLYLIRHDDNAR